MRKFALHEQRLRMRGLRLTPRLNWILPSSGLLRDVRWFETDVSGLRIGSILNVQAIQEDTWLSKVGLLGSPETSVLNHLTSRSNSEYGRIQRLAIHQSR
jgi:hypothetical protein